MKIVSWNVNGIRAIIKKNFFEDFKNFDADMFCIQETKAQDDQVQTALFELTDYKLFSNSAERKGYSGTAILSKQEPISVNNDIGIAEHDKEGRVLCLEYEKFFLINVYVPNSGGELKRLDYRKTWDLAFYEYLKNLEKTKPVIVCGDFNVAHRPIDLARPDANYDKNAGFTQIEIDGMDRFTEGKLCDTFRYFYPDKKDAYSWWSYRGGARQRNVGWRIDYFLASESLLPNLKNAEIHSDVIGSDHCPTSIEFL